MERAWVTDNPNELPTNHGMTKCPDFWSCDFNKPLLLILWIFIRYYVFAAESILIAITAITATANMLAQDREVKNKIMCGGPLYLGENSFADGYNK